MNEKTTQSDMDLKIRKMEFLENFLAFAKQVKKRVMQRFLDENITHKRLGFSEKDMYVSLYKSGAYVSLEWRVEYEADGIEANMHSPENTNVRYQTNPDVLGKMVDIPFEEFTGAFEKLFAELLAEQEPKTISVDVTPEQWDKMKIHGII